MQPLPLKRPVWMVLAFAGVLAVLVGCGTSDYRRLMASRVDKVRTGAAFRTLFGPSQLPGTPIKIRVPMAFGKSYAENSPQPPFLQLPGLKLCYEGTAADATSAKLPFYCYLAAVPARPGDADKLAADILAQLKRKLKETPDAWESKDASTPEGKALQWKRIRVVAEQPFLVMDAGKPTSKNMPGIFELWMYSAPEYIVLVGWRSPSSIEGRSPPVETAPINPLQGAVDAKPDFAAMPVLTAGTLTIDADAAPAADAAVP
jgi:hypothetical protein